MKTRAAEHKTLYVSNRDEWRSWLEENGDKESVIWLIFYKKHSGKRSVPYPDAVEEALCFGWIDSIIKRFDDEKYIQKFTPRKAKSTWSVHNVRRVREMIKQGRMTDKGLALYRYAEEKGFLPETDYKPEKDLVIPGFVADALSANKKAENYFNTLAPSQKRLYIRWIMDAKREETRIKRVQEMTGLLNKGKKPGLK
jgi:uncharacterized protein YdeI (YjbR/CyaY-like superfamily)